MARSGDEKKTELDKRRALAMGKKLNSAEKEEEEEEESEESKEEDEDWADDEISERVEKPVDRSRYRRSCQKDAGMQLKAKIEEEDEEAEESKEEDEESTDDEISERVEKPLDRSRLRRSCQKDAGMQLKAKLEEEGEESEESKEPDEDWRSSGRKSVQAKEPVDHASVRRSAEERVTIPKGPGRRLKDIPNEKEEEEDEESEESKEQDEDLRLTERSSVQVKRHVDHAEKWVSIPKGPRTKLKDIPKAPKLSQKREKENLKAPAGTHKTSEEASAGRESEKLKQTHETKELVKDEDEATDSDRGRVKGKAIASAKKEPTRERLLEGVIEIMRAVGDMSHYHTAKVIRNLGLMYCADLKDRREEVENIMSDAARILRAEEGSEEEEDSYKEPVEEPEEEPEDEPELEVVMKIVAKRRRTFRAEMGLEPEEEEEEELEEEPEEDPEEEDRKSDS